MSTRATSGYRDTMPQAPARTRTAVIGAMDKEIELLRAAMSEKAETRIGGIAYIEGMLEGVPTVLLKTGIGKVNAAMGAVIAIREFGAARVIFTGVAGAVSERLEIADIVVSDYLVQHDMDVTAFGYEPGRIPGDIRGQVGARFPADRFLAALALEAARDVVGADHVMAGTIATGDQFIADRERTRAIGERFGAACVEMEGAAVAQAAGAHGVPFVVLRAMSDRADGSAPASFTDFMEKAAANSARIVRIMLARLSRAAPPRDGDLSGG